MFSDRDILSHVNLQLQSKLIDIEDCWKEGYEAAQASHTETQNPYLKNTKAYQFWQDGWWSGFYEENFDFSKVQAPLQPAPRRKNYVYKLAVRASSLTSVALLGFFIFQWAEVVVM